MRDIGVAALRAFAAGMSWLGSTRRRPCSSSGSTRRSPRSKTAAASAPGSPPSARPVRDPAGRPFPWDEECPGQAGQRQLPLASRGRPRPRWHARDVKAGQSGGTSPLYLLHPRRGPGRGPRVPHRAAGRQGDAELEDDRAGGPPAGQVRRGASPSPSPDVEGRAGVGDGEASAGKLWGMRKRAAVAGRPRLRRHGATSVFRRVALLLVAWVRSVLRQTSLASTSLVRSACAP